MLLNVASTRYSLVKGERIVRFVLTTQLRELRLEEAHVIDTPLARAPAWLIDMGL